MDEVKLLSEPTNYAVVHLPGRAFPGVVFQGDSLSNLVRELEQAVAELDRNEREAALLHVIERLRGVQACYEAALERQGIPLPYLRR